VSSHSSVLPNLTLQERSEEGRMLEEWLYLQPRWKIEGGRWMEKMGGWDSGAQRAEEKVEEEEKEEESRVEDQEKWREVKRGQKEGKGRW